MIRRTLYPKICQHCGIAFQGRKETSYCSRKCGRAGATLTNDARYPKEVRPCKICGKEMIIGGRDGRNPEAVTCSRVCATQHRIVLLTKPLEIRLCIACQKPFGVGGRHGKQPRTVYCSRLCRSQAQYVETPHCNILTDVDAAYIAGFMDGEGCIFLTKKKQPQTYRVGVSIVNTKHAPLDWMVQVTGLSHVYGRDRGIPNNAPIYRWTIQGEGAETLLGQLLPYLRIKHIQARLAMSFQRQMRIPHRKVDQSWQVHAFALMQILNKRGTSVLPSAENFTHIEELIAYA